MKVVAGVTVAEQLVLNTLVPARAGTRVGGGSYVSIPADFDTRIKNGEHVPGCRYFRVEADGSLRVENDDIALIDAARANGAIRALCNAVALASFETKWAAAQVL